MVLVQSSLGIGSVFVFGDIFNLLHCLCNKSTFYWKAKKVEKGPSMLPSVHLFPFICLLIDSFSEHYVLLTVLFLIKERQKQYRNGHCMKTYCSYFCRWQSFSIWNIISNKTITKLQMLYSWRQIDDDGGSDGEENEIMFSFNIYSMFTTCQTLLNADYIILFSIC